MLNTLILIISSANITIKHKILEQITFFWSCKDQIMKKPPKIIKYKLDEKKFIFPFKFWIHQGISEAIHYHVIHYKTV